MAIKKITRKIISSQVKLDQSVTAQVQSEGVEKEAVDQTSAKSVRSKRGCLFCQKKTNPTYTDLNTLRRFLTDRAKIVGKERSGICSKHQRAIAKNIKYARHLALLPFVPKV